MENFKQSTLSMSEAQARIAGMLTEQMATGSIDSEYNTFQSIQARLANGEITPKEAIALAEGVVASRQDYH